jgi:hypothetical protein
MAGGVGRVALSGGHYRRWYRTREGRKAVGARMQRVRRVGCWGLPLEVWQAAGLSQRRLGRGLEDGQRRARISVGRRGVAGKGGRGTRGRG